MIKNGKEERAAHTRRPKKEKVCWEEGNRMGIDYPVNSGGRTDRGIFFVA